MREAGLLPFLHAFSVLLGIDGLLFEASEEVADAADALVGDPVDVLVDNVIGFLEEATAYMRTVANQVFSLLSGSVKESTVDLIVAVSPSSFSYRIFQSSFLRDLGPCR